MRITVRRIAISSVIETMKNIPHHKKIIIAIPIAAAVFLCWYITGNEHDAPSRARDCVAGSALWLRIGSNLENDEQFHAWREQFMSAQINRLEVQGNDIDIEVAGQDGIVSVTLKDNIVSTVPPAPTGILTLNSRDLGRPILERIPEIARFARQRDEAVPVVISPSGTPWEANAGYSVFDEVFESDGSVRVNYAVSWQVQIEQSGEYYLWGRVQTMDPQHDSFFVEAATRLPDGSFMRRSVNIDWHLGVHADWIWTRLPTPIHLTEGVWQLTLRPREYEGRIKQLFLTLDPSGKP